MKDLKDMTAAQVALKYYKAQSIVKTFEGKDDAPWADVWRKDYADYAAELDSRCEKAGIARNPDGSFSIAAFNLPLKEAEERAALINYMISKP